VIEPSSSGVVVTFKTRRDAENATQNISTIKFKENFQLNYSWFDEKKSKSDKINLSKNLNELKNVDEDDQEVSHYSTLIKLNLYFIFIIIIISLKIEALPDELMLDDVEDEDDTEDESEARNWKG
jgi:hypothetical protein